jgi:hypothetical protein
MDILAQILQNHLRNLSCMKCDLIESAHGIWAIVRGSKVSGYVMVVVW